MSALYNMRMDHHNTSMFAQLSDAWCIYTFVVFHTFELKYFLNYHKAEFVVSLSFVHFHQTFLSELLRSMQTN